MSHGARRLATHAEPKLNGFRAIATNLLDDDQFADAHDLVPTAVRLLERRLRQIVRKAQLVGQSIHADEMRADASFSRMRQERDEVYRNRINSHNGNGLRLRIRVMLMRELLS